jgi:hypothetical protein
VPMPLSQDANMLFTFIRRRSYAKLIVEKSPNKSSIATTEE